LTRAPASLRIGLLVVGSAVLFPVGVGAQPDGDATAAEADAVVLGPVSPGDSERVPDSESAADDPCGEPALSEDEEAALDRVRGSVYRGVCSSSRWLDSFFGDSRDYTEVYGQTYGRVGAGVDWNERDDFGVDGYLRAKFPLPALGRRYNAILGRDSEDSFIDDNFDEMTFLPGAFSDENVDNIWYAGINYARKQGKNQRTDISVGLQISSPLNPYIKFRYRYYAQPSDSLLLRLRVTPFWENRDGLGITIAGDSDWTFRDGWMLRWANTATFSEATDGVRWRSRLALFQQLSPKSAMRYEAAIRGETDGIQPKIYGGKITYRRALWREWFFVETGAALFWSRELDPANDCDACIGVGVGFEIAFGDRYDRHLEKSRQSVAPTGEPLAGDLLD